MNLLKNLFIYTFDFVGVENRKNFWLTFMFVGLFNLIFGLLCFLSNIFFTILVVYNLLILVPLLSLTARRLHDTDRSAFNLFWLFFPFVGIVVLMVYCLEKTKYFVTENNKKI